VTVDLGNLDEADENGDWLRSLNRAAADAVVRGELSKESLAAGTDEEAYDQP
jgi:hypothetical protein